MPKPEQDASIDGGMNAGEQRRAKDTRNLERLRLLIKQGVDAIERGDYVEVNDEDLDAFLDGLTEAQHRY